MYCPKCGAQNEDNNFRCIKCNYVIQSVQPPSIHIKETNPVKIVLWVAVPLMIVFILGILAAIAIPAYINAQTKARENIARSQAKAACFVAQELFSQDPNKTITYEDLEKQGFIRPDVEVLIKQGTRENMLIKARHTKGKKIYSVDKECVISEITQWK
ncbi:MAG: hypothetical protein LLF28_05300 [Nitrospiraceae bacterium]|nr:hypothetical protein [Nitrospiraceae bacterium]